MNLIDHSIISAVTRLANHSYTFDLIVYYLSYFDTPKGGFIMALFYGAWQSSKDEKTSEIAAAAIVGCLAAVAVTRAASMVSPFRMRPGLLVPVPFAYPTAIDIHKFNALSSFPSDHACLFSALSLGVFRMNRRLGLLAFVWTAVAICLARVYLGLHYPTDILAGAALGLAVMGAALSAPVRPRIAAPLLRIERRWSPWYHAAYFLIAFETATLFDTTQKALEFVHDILTNLSHHLT